jgi:plasmid maintenance system killer protein
VRLQLEAENKKLRKLLDDTDKLTKTIGVDMTKILKRRLDQLRASNNFKEFLDVGLGDPHPLVGNLDNLFGIKINKNYRLIVEPLTTSLDDDSLRNCKNVNLKGVADYHDGKCEWLIP